MPPERGSAMEPWGKEFAGRIEEHTFRSAALAGNVLGDPSERPLWVYLPPGYEESDARYPTVYVIQGLTGQIDMWRNRAAFRPNYLELMDDLFAGRQAPPAIVVFVDAWTSLGGSQFLNSTGTGRYHDYLCEELVPFVVETGRLIDDVWERWLAWDPVRMVPRYADAVRSLKAIYVDAGKKDEWFLDNGAVAVKKELDALGVACEFELFDAGHMSIEYRYPKSLAYICEQLAAD